MAKKKSSGRKVLRSIGFLDVQLDCYEELEKVEGGSLSEHVRVAFTEYLQKKGYDISEE